MRRESRFSALWGTGSKGGKEILTGALTLVALALPLAAGAEPGKGKAGGAFVPAGLLQKAERDQDATFRVIVQGEGKGRGAVAAEGGHVKREFDTVEGVAAEVTGKQLAKLARRGDVAAITEDAATKAAAYDVSYERSWRDAATVPGATGDRQPPTIAIVDSGIDAAHPALAGRVLTQVTLTTLLPNSPGDGRGHGTLVASIAAGGESSRYPGVAPQAKLVSLDVMNDLGEGRVSDVIAACDWILQNKDRYGIRVANFSLHAGSPSSFRNDPLDMAVEKLWFNGVVVVTAAGNYGVNGEQTRVQYAPANDPFVITAGAVDIAGSKPRGDDLPAVWSAYGYTGDGFAKPELVAPGRYMAGAVPAVSTMAAEHPERVLAPGYMWMSGTSFAAPIIAGGAAWVLANNPTWTPDQVKGALMASAFKPYGFPGLSLGIGEVRITSAWYYTDPPNPNAALNRFVGSDPVTGQRAFDAAAWSDAAWSDAAWDSAAWSDAAWSNAAWSDAAWNSAAWSDAAWSDAAWSDAAWSDAAWADSIWVE